MADLVFDRLVSATLLTELGPGGHFNDLLRRRATRPAVADLQLRREQRGRRSWVSLYMGLTSVLDLDERAGLFRYALIQRTRKRASSTRTGAAGSLPRVSEANGDTSTPTLISSSQMTGLPRGSCNVKGWSRPRSLRANPIRTVLFSERRWFPSSPKLRSNHSSHPFRIGSGRQWPQPGELTHGGLAFEIEACSRLWVTKQTLSLSMREVGSSSLRQSRRMN